MADKYVLEAEFRAKADDLTKKLDKIDSSINGMKSGSGKLGSALGKVGKGIIAAFAVDKVVSFGTQVVETTARLNAMDAQFEQIFKGAEGEEAVRRISDASQDLGIHTDRLTSSFNQFGAQVKGAGMESSQAMEATEKATRLAADSAAFYDRSLEDTTAALSSFMKGNFSAGDSIGVFTSAKQMDSQANEMYGKSWVNLTEDEKQWLLLDTVEKTYELNGAMGQAARESGEYENVMGNLKATWDEFLSVIGQPILTVVLAVMQALIGVIGNAVTWVEGLGEKWRVFQEQLGITDFSGLLEGLPIVQMVKDAFVSVVDWFQLNWPRIQEIFMGVWQVIQDVWNTVGIPIFTVIQEIIGTVIDFVVGLLPHFMTAFQIAFEGIQVLWNNILKPVFEAIIPHIENLWSIVQEYFPIIQEVVSTAFQVAKDAWDNILKPALEAIGSFIQDTLLPIVNRVFDKFTENVREAFESIRDVWNNVLKPVLDGLVDTILNAKDFIVESFTTAKETTIEVFEAIKTGIIDNITAAWDGITGTISDIVDGISDGISDAWQEVLSFKTKFFNAGKNIVNSIADGIREAIGSVTSAIGNVASKIRSYLPFSPAKEGPLRDLDELNFGGTISESIYRGEVEVTRAMAHTLTLPKGFSDIGKSSNGSSLENGLIVPFNGIFKFGERSYRAHAEDLMKEQAIVMRLEEVYM